jgi:hypothetical protein
MCCVGTVVLIFPFSRTAGTDSKRSGNALYVRFVVLTSSSCTKLHDVVPKQAYTQNLVNVAVSQSQFDCLAK